MRDIILLAAIVGLIPFIFRAPIVGLLAWIWITLMNPQREVYSFLADAQLNLAIAVITLLAWLASKERKVAPLNLTTVSLVVFAFWACLTTYFAIHPDVAGELLSRTLKTIALALAVATLVNRKSRVQAVIWVVALSLGYFAIKGGGFVIMKGGGERVYGPENSMIADNNSLGLALVMLLPLVNHLRTSSQNVWVRRGCLVVMALTCLAIFGTYSRGALLALGAAVVVYALRAKSGVFAIAIAALLIGVLPSVMPASWLERMSSIKTYDEDSSFAGRVAAWETSFNIAVKRPTGGGFSAVESTYVAQTYHSPGSLDAGRAAHSIYFQVLGDHGFVGLAMYLVLIGVSVLNTFMVLSATRGRPDLQWAAQLTRMLQVSIAAFAVGGAALSMAYYDGFLILLVLTGALLQIVRQPVAALADEAPGPKWKRLPAQALPALPRAGRS